MARILISTFGSLGDLHPSLALGLALAARGHRAVVATHPEYRARVEAAGLAFAPVRPDIADYGRLPDLMKRAMDERRGSEFVVRGLVLPRIRESYDDLMRAAPGTDLMVAHMLSFAGALVAERLGIPRVSQVLQPYTMLSAYDPPYMTAPVGARWLHGAGPAVWKLLWSIARRTSRPWFRGCDALRADIGLRPSRRHPLFDGPSPLLHLASFPSALASPQPDWPPHTLVTGSCDYDRAEDGSGLPERVRAFLDAGEPPVVFTLGSSGVWTGASFYAAAAEAVRAIGRRAVLLVGDMPENVPPRMDDDVLAVDYAPHSELFTRAAANVHHGGIGTTSQALRAGRPMVIVPYSHDQPDNAWRCQRLGVGRMVRRRAISAARLAAALREVLGDPAYAERAAEVGRRTRAERGAEAAADAIERVLDAGRPAVAAGATAPRP